MGALEHDVIPFFTFWCCSMHWRPFQGHICWLLLLYCSSITSRTTHENPSAVNTMTMAVSMVLPGSMQCNNHTASRAILAKAFCLTTPAWCYRMRCCSHWDIATCKLVEYHGAGQYAASGRLPGNTYICICDLMEVASAAVCHSLWSRTVCIQSQGHPPTQGPNLNLPMQAQGTHYMSAFSFSYRTRVMPLTLGR